MTRQLIIEMELTDEQLAQILPSGTVWVEITAAGGKTLAVPGEILKIFNVTEESD